MFLTSLTLHFDFIMIMILMAMFLIGYISGATIELIKLIKVIVPFLVVFYFGGYFARIIFKSSQFNRFISRFDSFESMAYFNTFVMLLSTFIAFFGAYFVLSIIIKQIQKTIQTEMVAYKLGKLNKSAGAFLAGIRYYILASVLILPFFMMGVTDRNEDVTTKLILDYPPSFTRVGMIVNTSEPILNASNSLTSFLDVVDLKDFKQYYDMINNVDQKITELENQIMDKYNRLKAEGATITLTSEEPRVVLQAFANDPDVFINQAQSEALKNELIEDKKVIAPYNGLIDWAIAEDIDSMTNVEIIDSFTTHYETIIEQSNDPEMKEKLKNARHFIIIKNWLEQELSIDTANLDNLLVDENIEKILEKLVIEFNEQEHNGLIYDLYQLNDEELNENIKKIEVFVADYQTTYRDLMAEIKVQMPFKYKLIASTMHDVNFVDSLERSPVMAMYVIDTIDFLNSSGIFQFGDDNLYQTVVKIIIPLYLVEKDVTGQINTIDETKMNDILSKMEYFIDQVVITEAFANQLVEGLVEATYYGPELEEPIPYITYLIESNQFTPESFEVLSNHPLFKDNEKITSAIDSILSEEGDGNV